MHNIKQFIILSYCVLVWTAFSMEENKMALSYILNKSMKFPAFPTKGIKKKWYSCLSSLPNRDSNLCLKMKLKKYLRQNKRGTQRIYFKRAFVQADIQQCLNLFDEEYGWTALHYAAYTNSLRICKKLVNGGCDVTRQDINGKLPHELASGSFTHRYLLKQYRIKCNETK